MQNFVTTGFHIGILQHFKAYRIGHSKDFYFKEVWL